MAYGTPEGVASLARTWTDNGEFTDPDLYDPGTNPTETQVEEWLDQVSVFMDIALANHGFAVPITQEEVIKALALRVNSLVADLVHLVHSKGRLFSDRIQESGLDPMSVIERDVSAWVKARISAWEAYGIPRSIDLDDTQAYSVPMSRQT